MTKELKKVVMNSLKLRNKFLKTRTGESEKRFNHQTNSYVRWLHKTERRFLGEIDHRVVSDNRKYLKTLIPFFSEKDFHKESNLLINSNKTFSNIEELAVIYNKHFSKSEKNLDIKKILTGNIANSGITDPVFNAIEKYKNRL